MSKISQRSGAVDTIVLAIYPTYSGFTEHARNATDGKRVDEDMQVVTEL